MAKDYFQDILPPSDDAARQRPAPETPDTNARPIPVHIAEGEPAAPRVVDVGADEALQPARTIRNISMPTRNSRPRPILDVREPSEQGRFGGGRWWLWGIAGVCVLALGALVLVAFRPTTVTVTPRSHLLTFDGTTTFTAYPAASAATGTLSYSVQTADFNDSEVVASTGTVHAEDKASGSLTIYNGYQSAPLKLVKSTRFQSADGHIFRTPAEVVIPGKSGTTPGQVTITVIADQAGAEYNVPAGKFTVPGLKSSAAQFAAVYAQSSSAMSGGLVGDKPGVSDSAMQQALSAMRTRLAQKANAAVSSTGDSLVLPGLTRITYQDAPTTDEAGGKVRLHESAHADIPVLSASAFASAVSADVAGSPVDLVTQQGFAAQAQNASSTLGAAPLQFTLTGSAQIVWKIDQEALKQALAGKEQSAFQAIVTQFPGVSDARARIEPFWKGSFPTDPSAIQVVVEAPKS
jgi:hypothetical protein